MCSNVLTSGSRLKSQLEEFSNTVIALHEAHVETEVKSMFTSGFNTNNWAYSKFPKGISIALTNFGELKVIQGAARDDAYRITWNAIEPDPDPNALTENTSPEESK